MSTMTDYMGLAGEEPEAFDATFDGQQKKDPTPGGDRWCSDVPPEECMYVVYNEGPVAVEAMSLDGVPVAFWLPDDDLWHRLDPRTGVVAGGEPHPMLVKMIAQHVAGRNV